MRQPQAEHPTKGFTAALPPVMQDKEEGREGACTVETLALAATGETEQAMFLKGTHSGTSKKGKTPSPLPKATYAVSPSVVHKAMEKAAGPLSTWVCFSFLHFSAFV